MKFYWVKTHWLIKKMLPGFIWDLPASEKVVYLTFDDGPTPEITTWTLKLLKSYNSKATFFCIGENIAKFPEIFTSIQKEGHTIGNHTYNHLNGWKFSVKEYLENVTKCQQIIDNLHDKNHLSAKPFRPPYGKLKKQQYKFLRKSGYKIVMWDVLSADFDTAISPEQCAENVLKNIRPGSIIIFHDSVKASTNLKYALPKTLNYLQEMGYKMKAIKFAPEPD